MYNMAKIAKVEHNENAETPFRAWTLSRRRISWAQPKIRLFLTRTTKIVAGGLLSLVLTGCRPRVPDAPPPGQTAAATDVPTATVAGVWPTYPDSLFREGDLVFRRGRGVSSEMVLLCEDEPIYSHVGLLIRTDDATETEPDFDGWIVVHAAPDERGEPGRYDRVMAEPLSDFWRHDRCRAGGVYRFPLDGQATARLTAEARRLAAEGRPFDHRFDERDTTAFYCTELIHFLFAKTGFDATQGRRTRDRQVPFAPPLILPGHLLAHPDLRPVWCFPSPHTRGSEKNA